MKNYSTTVTSGPELFHINSAVATQTGAPIKEDPKDFFLYYSIVKDH